MRIIGGILTGAFIVLVLFGEVMCIVKCIDSDWKPSYKREIIYGVSAAIGVGAVVGYLNIPDGPVEDSKQ